MQRKQLEEIHEDMVRLMVQAEGIGALARAVDSLTLALAQHAAWSEERFDQLEQALTRQA